MGADAPAWRRRGARFAAQHAHDNGYGGFAHRAWETTTWLESVIDSLGLSEAGVTRIREVIAARKLAQKAAREADTAAAEEAFRRFQAAKGTGDAAQVFGAGARGSVILVLGAAATAFGLDKAVLFVRRGRQQRADG